MTVVKREKPPKSVNGTVLVGQGQNSQQPLVKQQIEI